MHAWISGRTVVAVLPSEVEPETMGQIYAVSYHDSETLEELAQLRRTAAAMEENFHRRLAAKLIKEQGN
jgi:hypothetical protein